MVCSPQSLVLLKWAFKAAPFKFHEKMGYLNKFCAGQLSRVGNWNRVINSLATNHFRIQSLVWRYRGNLDEPLVMTDNF